MKEAEFTLREVSHDEYIGGLRKELESVGLYKAVEKRCDEIDDICSSLGYVAHRSVQEQLSEIMDIIEEGAIK